MIRLLPAGLYTEMPWKNGQGVTREVARYPEGGNMTGVYPWRPFASLVRSPHFPATCAISACWKAAGCT